MISYNRLWETMKSRGISQYNLIKDYKVSASLIDKLRKNSCITTNSLERLCSILNCRIEDIVEYIPDDTEWLYIRLVGAIHESPENVGFKTINQINFI